MIFPKTTLDIESEHKMLEIALLTSGGSYIDFDGRRVDMPMTDAEQQMFARYNMLEELMELTVPILKSGWGFDMAHGMCPCTLSLTKYL